MIKPLPPEVRKRLALMLPLLASSNGGECAAAANAISRLLKGHDLDWHDLTAAIAEPTSAPRSQPASSPRRSPKERNLTPEEVKILVSAIYAGRGHLDARARAFLDGQLARAKYGRVLFSDKQWAWLMDLTKQAEAT